MVYILFSGLKNRFYVGFTGEHIVERLRKHNTNHKGFTGNTGDWQIMYTENFSDKESPIKREKDIIRWKRRNRIEELIAGSKHSG